RARGVDGRAGDEEVDVTGASKAAARWRVLGLAGMAAFIALGAFATTIGGRASARGSEEPPPVVATSPPQASTASPTPTDTATATPIPTPTPIIASAFFGMTTVNPADYPRLPLGTLGYAPTLSWASVEPTRGVFDFTGFD